MDPDPAVERSNALGDTYMKALEMLYSVIHCRSTFSRTTRRIRPLISLTILTKTCHLTLHERSVTHAADPDSTVELPNDLKSTYMKALEVLYPVIHCREHVQSHCSSNPTVISRRF